MKKLGLLSLAMLLAVGVSFARAEDVKSGPQPGDEVGAYTVEKCSGNPNDSVEVGESLCYRCKLGTKPVVMIFSRKADKQLAALVKELDGTLPKHADQKLSSFVNLIGSKDTEALKETAKTFGDTNKPQNIAIVVPNDSENGPEGYKISPEAEVTVILYRNGKVEANHSFAPGKLSSEGIAAIVADTAKILN